MYKLKSFSINIFFIIAMLAGMYLCYNGKVNWWTFLVVLLFQIHLDLSWSKKVNNK